METTTLLGINLGLVIGLALGYLVGRLQKSPTTIPLGHYSAASTVNAPSTPQVPAKSPASTPQVPRKIDINEAKFVAPVDTGGMERLDRNELGTTTVSQDDIQGSVSRLAQLKGN